jgi:hypothetical protein
VHFVFKILFCWLNVDGKQSACNVLLHPVSEGSAIAGDLSAAVYISEQLEALSGSLAARLYSALIKLKAIHPRSSQYYSSKTSERGAIA